MPSDDREQQFERGLARHLRGGSADAACPDAEILAAYHERTLAPEELEQWKKHIAGCARCQETLALVESSELVLEEQKEQEAVAHFQPASTLLPAEMASAPTVRQVAASGASITAMKASGALKSVAGKKSKILRWAAPLGAIAAVLILWVSLRTSKNSLENMAAPNSVQVAENRESRQQVSQDEPKAADEGMAAALATKKTLAPGDVAREKDSGTKPAPPLIRPPAVTGPAHSAGVYAQRDAWSVQDRSDKQIAREAAQGKVEQPVTPAKKNNGVSYGMGATVGATRGTAEPSEAPAAVVRDNASDANALSAKVAANAPAASSAKSLAAPRVTENKAKEDALPNSRQTVKEASTTASADTSSTSQAVAGENKQDHAFDRRNDVIVAATGKQGWRVGTGGLIEYRGDGGKTWKAQKSGVTADLISGSAPTEKICWVVGKAGTLLLTSDGGKHWKVLSTPVGEDLARVEAMDAQHAKIWSAGDNAAYVTDNGGLSWSSASDMK